MKHRLKPFLLLLAALVVFGACAALAACNKKPPDTPPAPVGHTHTLTFHPAVDATCAREGNVAYWSCSGCELLFADEDATEQLQTVSTPKVDHAPVLRTGSRATADTDGTIDYYECPNCGKWFYDLACTLENAEKDAVEQAHGGMTFTKNADALSYTLSDKGAWSGTTLSVPKHYCSLPVTAIAASCFSGCSELTALTLPETIRSVGEQAFCDCDSLETVDIADLAAWCDIEFADSDANPMYYADSLLLDGEPFAGALAIPDGAKSVPSYSFYGCDGLTSLSLPASVASIGTQAFAYCGGLRSISVDADNRTFRSSGNCLIETESGTVLLGCAASVIPDAVTAIAKYAFAGCAIETVSIPASVTSIADRAFASCESLTSVTIGGGAQIGARAFAYCTALSTVTLGDGASSIGDYAFAEGGLTAISFGDGLTAIGERAFYACSALTAAALPNSVTELGEYAFGNCSHLRTVTLSSALTSIADGVFSGCSALMRIAIPDGVAEIGAHAFFSCGGLTSVTLGRGVTTIADNAFDLCAKLVEVRNLSETVELKQGSTGNGRVAQYALDIYTDEETPSKIETEGDWVFYRSDTLRLLAYTGDAADLVLPKKNEPYEIFAKAFYHNDAIASVSIPENVTAIGDNAFDTCTSLTRVSIGKDVASIGKNAFDNNIALTAVEIADVAAWCNIAFPKSTFFADYRASNPLCFAKHLFLNGKEVETLTIPDGVTQLCTYLFCNAEALTSVVIPASVITIETKAFFGCTALKTVWYASDESDWSGVTGASTVFSSAEVLFFASADPAEEGYWHYASDGVTPERW